MRISFFAAAAALLAAAPAVAQPRVYSPEEIASDLAYGFCPLFLAGKFPLNSPQLAERGFGTKVTTESHPQLGEMGLVAATYPGGEIAFGGASGRMCRVILTGPKRDAALKQLKDTMSYTGLPFQPTPNVGEDVPGMTTETFKAPIEGGTLYVQLIDAREASNMISAQLFYIAK
ncbi:MAG TPA: hypothetical protein VF655_04675 [Allosphingosinicella sp.]|jgi:hypothetical protein